MNRFDFLKHVQHFDAHDFNQEIEKEKKKNNILLASFHVQHYEAFWKINDCILTNF